ncbi:hypothetical protein, partial [Klebsiella pneumoniae]|uniref:hypothetical protein n=1 Tax=Klebsiella pneumoniae TaxID=573 RepID=UPI001C6303A5
MEFAESAVDEGYSLSRAAIRAAPPPPPHVFITSLAVIRWALAVALPAGHARHNRVAAAPG